MSLERGERFSIARGGPAARGKGGVLFSCGAELREKWQVEKVRMKVKNKGVTDETESPKRDPEPRPVVLPLKVVALPGCTLEMCGTVWVVTGKLGVLRH